jgi:hypothetical protein
MKHISAAALFPCTHELFLVQFYICFCFSYFIKFKCLIEEYHIISSGYDSELLNLYLLEVESYHICLLTYFLDFFG